MSDRKIRPSIFLSDIFLSGSTKGERKHEGREETLNSSRP